MTTVIDSHDVERDRWRRLKPVRPARVVTPGSGQESVRDYPRPPRVKPVARRIRVEFGGVAERPAENATWCYPEPDAGYEVSRNCLAFYAAPMDACYVGEHRVQPQPGDYYGGLITPEIVEPFKGNPGSARW